MAELLVNVIGSDLPPRQIVLVGPLSVGRSDQCDLSVDDRHLSREHCRFEPLADAGEWRVVDCQSTNGTRIGTERVDEYRLVDGDVVIAGPMRIEFRADASIASPRASQLLTPSETQAIATKGLANDTILDGIIATGQSSGARFPATARRSPPRLRPTLIKSIASGRKPKTTSISIADLLRDESAVETTEVEVVPTMTPEKTPAKFASPFATDANVWRGWWIAATEFFRRRLL